MGILGNNQGQYTLLDGTFSNNKAIGVRPAGVNVALSDGIILSRYVVEGPVEAGVANCTFAGEGGIPLYVVNGPTALLPRQVWRLIRSSWLRWPEAVAARFPPGCPPRARRSCTRRRT